MSGLMQQLDSIANRNPIRLLSNSSFDIVLYLIGATRPLAVTNRMVMVPSARRTRRYTAAQYPS